MADFRWLTFEQRDHLVDLVNKDNIIGGRPQILNRLLEEIPREHREKFLQDLPDDTPNFRDRLTDYCEHLCIQEPLADGSVPIAVFLASVVCSCNGMVIRENPFRNMLQCCLAAAERAASSPPDPNQCDGDAWKSAAQFIEMTIQGLPTPRAAAGRVTPFTTEETKTPTARIGHPAAIATEVERQERDSFDAVYARSKKIERIKPVVPTLETYIKTFNESLEPLRCCMNIADSIETLMASVERLQDHGRSGRRAEQAAFKQKVRETQLLLDDPCVDSLRAWASTIVPPIPSIAEEKLRLYEESCSQVRRGIDALSRLETLDNGQQLREAMRKVRTPGLLMQSLWQDSHSALFAEIQTWVKYMNRVLAEETG